MAKKIADKLLLNALTTSNNNTKNKTKSKSLNVDQLPSLNVNATNAGERFARLGKEDLKSGNMRMETMMAGLGIMPNSFMQGVSNKYFTDPKVRSLMDKKMVVKQMKKGGKVKAKKPKDGRIKKAKCRDGIAQRGKTRGRMR